jgi:hypothetical protein
MATELVIEASPRPPSFLEVSQSSILEIGAAGPQGESAVLADGVTSGDPADGLGRGVCLERG